MSKIETWRNFRLLKSGMQSAREIKWIAKQLRLLDMKNEAKKNGRSASGSKNPGKTFDQAVEEQKEHLKAPPSVQEVRAGVEAELRSAYSFLSLVLSSPVLMDKMANEIHELTIKPRIHSVQNQD